VPVPTTARSRDALATDGPATAEPSAPARWKLASGDPSPSTAFLCVDSVRDDREVVVSLHGALDMAASHLIARQLLELLSEPIRTITLQLDAVTFVDSSGIGVLTIARTHAHQRGIRFFLRSVPASVLAVLRVAGMLDFFDLDLTSDLASSDD
jgi:anti-anti-sigma factor